MLLEVKNLSCRRGEIQALQNVSFSVKKGELLGIMGATGSGKTTLIQAIAGLIPPTAGQILLEGKDICHPRYDRSLLRQAVGLVFQYPEVQLFETTVERDVAFGLKHRSLTKQQMQSRIQWALEEMGFCYAEIRSRSPLSLSGGERRRVAIAGILAADPQLLIFDEPIAGLDPLARRAFAATLQRLRQKGKTILIVSHNADFLCQWADRIMALEQGTLLADAAPQALFADLSAAEAQGIGGSSYRRMAEALYRRGFLDSPAPTTCQALAEAILRKAGDRP